MQQVRANEKLHGLAYDKGRLRKDRVGNERRRSAVPGFENCSRRYSNILQMDETMTPSDLESILGRPSCASAPAVKPSRFASAKLDVADSLLFKRYGDTRTFIHVVATWLVLWTIRSVRFPFSERQSCHHCNKIEMTQTASSTPHNPQQLREPRLWSRWLGAGSFHRDAGWSVQKFVQVQKCQLDDVYR